MHCSINQVRPAAGRGFELFMCVNMHNSGDFALCVTRHVRRRGPPGGGISNGAVLMALAHARTNERGPVPSSPKKSTCYIPKYE